jgi:hypothetical protein
MNSPPPTKDQERAPTFTSFRGGGTLLVFDRKTVDEVYNDIVSVIKKANQVQKAKLKFDSSTNQSLEKFTFTILGLKVDGNHGRLTIAFLQDKQDFVMVVTIL